MTNRAKILLIIAISITFIGSWAWGILIGNPLPVLLWFGVAALVVAGG